MCDELLLEQLKSLIENERNVIANLANASALLHLSLEEINWAGFYLAEGEELILGPFQGKPACIRIPFGQGVCGTAAQTDTVQRIDNVHLFAGHIACDGASNAESVIPLHKNGKVVGVLDIDSPVFHRFSETDQQILEQFCRILEKGCEF